MAENVRSAMRNSYEEYLRITELFRCGDPNAENSWRNFCNTENFGFAIYAINNPEFLIAE